MYNVLKTEGYEKIMNKYKISSLAAKAMIGNNLSFTNKIEGKNPFAYKDMDKVVSLILKNINSKNKIAIYGDYDVDGICSVSILYRTFKLLNYEVGYYVPNRYEDGYGLSNKIVDQMHDKGYCLIICVDNGIKAFDAIERARSYEMDVIVLDHHQKEENLPNFNLYLHPEYSSFSEYNMCGASICYYLSKALLSYEDEICLALAGISTIGDVMPLVEQNKYIVNKAIAYLNKNKYKAIDLLNTDNKSYDELLISMQIVPKLNSVGRICKNNTVNKVVKYLTTNDTNELMTLSKFIIETNEKRKDISDSYFKKIDKGNYNNKIIIEKDDEMLEGINGIIASKFADKYNLPTIIFSLDESKNFYKGSARSVCDFDIVEIFKDNPYIETYGGHKKAAGLTIKKENFDEFSKSIIEITKNNEYKEIVLDVVELNIDELSYKAYLDLLKFAPFGEGNPIPLFLIKEYSKENINKTKDNKHISINFNSEANLIGFNLVNNLNDDITNYDLIFKLEKNNFFHKKISCKCVSIGGSERCLIK